MTGRSSGNVGLVEVYTGDGKGKTTAAAGLALRMLARGGGVLFVQFLKGSPRLSGEVKLLSEKFPNFKLARFGTWVTPQTPKSEVEEKLKPEISRGLDYVEAEVRTGAYDLLVLDELNLALKLGVASLQRVLDIISHRPSSMEVVITGRDAPAEILEIADLVTEMRKVKHPFDKGVKAREGIEY